MSSITGLALRSALDLAIDALDTNRDLPDVIMTGVHPKIRKEREALRQCQLVREALRERDPWKDIDILQGRLIERTDQALHTARRDAETIRVLREALSEAAQYVDSREGASCYASEDVERWRKLAKPE